jgi:hypothetical protein
MPRTVLEKLVRANRWRIREGKMASDDTSGWNGCFLIPLDGQLYHVIISDGMGWRHVSIRNAQKNVVPSWGIMCRLRDLFFSDDAWVVQFHPPAEEYIDDHPWTLHLWESLDEPMPHPSIVLV